ncbi:hypothetical protein B0H99_102338 [Planomicrobium soli]|uniref:Uncharacterized protein n=1 Tax=Planomicrobium soli TaxID=1176648 RepID=A0A2P8H640_9BACL|nr:hypothetical protein [Planomicrobium soli]PSL41654.1 hypothetical protein B0H99_102338 [Planomicrobium soli]
MNWLPKRKDKVVAFWEWFEANGQSYYELTDDKTEKLLTQLDKKIRKVNDDLAWEFSSELVDGKREFIVSADGIVEAFDDVVHLVKAAPELPGFEIIPFRQARNDDFSAECNGVKLTMDDIFYSHEIGEQTQLIHLCLYIKGLTAEQEEEYISLALVLLDSAIGEYNVGMHVGEIEFERYKYNRGVKPLDTLKELFKESLMVLE